MLSNTPEACVMSIGHSTRAIGDFVGLLKANQVDLLVDVRTVPKSRHNPQFNKDRLPEALGRAGIEYLHMAALGGLRRARKNSSNTGWKNASFRGYADYMQTPEFEAALEDLLVRADGRRVALMCAEAVPWRCHRSLIGDALLAHGITLAHILSLEESSAPQTDRVRPSRWNPRDIFGPSGLILSSVRLLLSLRAPG